VSNDVSFIDYYAKRANEYDRIYEKPERQNDLAKLKELCRNTFAGHAVFEIACGTGCWTQAISQTAKSITATDFNEEVLQIARAKKYGCKVSFRKADAFNLSFPQNNFTAGLAAAWWSHLRKSEIKNFLFQFHRQFSSGALMVFMDNRFVPGSNTPISRTDDAGNTYQLRKLENGNEYEVLKHFPDKMEAKRILTDSAIEICWTELEYYWLLTYKLK
jgi:demethylmenaquinone methyltransferase/2-methoxy-6-polyprenyl-1,4-benzoquinol methylase